MDPFEDIPAWARLNYQQEHNRHVMKMYLAIDNDNSVGGGWGGAGGGILIGPACLPLDLLLRDTATLESFSHRHIDLFTSLHNKVAIMHMPSDMIV